MPETALTCHSSGAAVTPHQGKRRGLNFAATTAQPRKEL